MAGGGGRGAGLFWRLMLLFVIALVIAQLVLVVLRIDLVQNVPISPLHSDTRSSSSSNASSDSCEEWLEEQDKLHDLRNFDEDPIRVNFSEEQGTEHCAVRCIFGVAFSGTNKADAIFGYHAEEGIARVARTMESTQYYTEFDVQTAHRFAKDEEMLNEPKRKLFYSRGYTVVMTTSLASDVPAGYFSWAEYDIMAPMEPKTEKALAAAFISNCGGHNFRLAALIELQNLGVTVDSYGSCHRNVHRSVDKVEALRHYKFSLAFENSNEEDYVTEKFWQSLVAGTVPIVIGAPNIQDFAPTPDSIIHLRSIDDVREAAARMKYLAANDTAFNRTLRWKIEGPSDSFKALVDMAAVHSSCRLCIHLATDIHQREEIKGNHSRPCSCTKSTSTTHHVFVRERGRFNAESIFLRSDNMSVSALVDAIVERFESKKHIPVWNKERPEMLRVVGDKLRVYKVYPVGLTQRQALYSWKFSDETLSDYVHTHPCAKLEVIFV